MNDNQGQALEKFRELMKKIGIGAYVLYMGDPHNSEHPGLHDKRITFLSGFRGSAGHSVITLDSAYLWTDGRYYTQALNQLEDGWTLMRSNYPGVPTMLEFLSNLPVKSIGLDGSTTTISEFNIMNNQLTSKEIEVVQPSLVDVFMGDKQPSNKSSTIINHPLEVAGMDTQTKISQLKEKIMLGGTDCLFVSGLDEVAWVMNMRANDITNVPVFYSYLLITSDKVVLFVNKDQLSNEAMQMLNENSIEIMPYTSVKEFLRNFFTEKPNSKMWMDPRTNSANYFCVTNPKENVVLKQSPIVLMKSVKNEAEMNGMRKAHIKDSVALTKFFYWIEKSKEDGSLFKYNEFELAQKLNNYRGEQEGFKCTSMGTISGNGLNSAIIHYRPSETDSATIHEAMLLVDSGGHYTEGSTDITRTIHLGKPTEFEKLCYTMVLKGHIALAKAIFPQKTKGPQLDCLARQFLWSYGLDFFHGTGHGVGSVLTLHEGPINISTYLGGPASQTDLTPGMIVSNEPGYYDTEKKFGIRIENLLAVQKATTEHNFSGISYNSFEILSYFPIDTKLIDFSHMSSMEVDWLNNYHQTTFEKVSKCLKEQSEMEGVDYSHYIEWLRFKTSKLTT